MSPPLTLPPGFVQDSVNWEAVVSGGYRQGVRYERFDGRLEPHDAVYYTLPATITGAWVVGNTITGLTSGATAVILTNNINGFIVTKKTGTFVAVESLQIAAVTIATSTALLYAGGALTVKLNAEYLNLAADVYRALILAVPGFGDIIGGFTFQDVSYVFRNKAGGTAGVMFKSTSSGWSAITLPEELSFTAGNSSVNDGDVLTQGAVTATIQRVVATSGVSPNIVGRLIVTARAGGNFGAGAATSTGGGALTLSGIQTQITLSPGGRYEHEISNFGGALATKRVYACNGVDRGFEWDGTVFVPISTGMTIDKPNFVTVHKKQLFFAFGASVQHSAPGTPYVWSVILGASEIATGDNVTGFSPETGSATEAALYIADRNISYVLYGTGVANWNLITVNPDGGALAYTVQRIGSTYALDDIGILNLGATFAYGNFTSSTISYHIQPYITANKGLVAASITNRELSQYRLFFSNNNALYVTIGPKGVIGMMPQQFLNPVRCCWRGEFSDGSERTFFGSSDGFVYRMDVGSSFDGEPISHRFKLAFNHSKSPRTRKRYRQAAFEVQGTTYAEFDASYILGYASPEIFQPNALTLVTDFNPAFWDSFVWDAFIWDGKSLSPSELDLSGTAENIALLVSGSSDFIYPFTLSGSFLHFSPRRNMR